MKRTLFAMAASLAILVAACGSAATPTPGSTGPSASTPSGGSQEPASVAPVSGTVKKLNATLESAPERVNEDCWGEGWMLALQPDDAAAAESLLNPAAYREHIASLEH